MKRIELLASQSPIAFGFIITFVFIFMLIVSAILGNLWHGQESFGQPGAILGRGISTIVMLMLLSYLGWMKSAGFTTPGHVSVWVITTLLLTYSILASSYAFKGSFNALFSITGIPFLTTIFIAVAAFMEEVVFRGLILHPFIHTWGMKKAGTTKGVVISSLLFSSIHLLDFLSGRPLSAVLLQSLNALLLGVILASLVLIGKSIYPAVLFHLALNISAYVLIGSNHFEPAPYAWLSLSLLMIIPTVVGIYIVKTRYRTIPDKQMTNDIYAEE
jgi:membrane protease YdiL (CAAX protease family)